MAATVVRSRGAGSCASALGHLANPKFQLLEVYRAGDCAWKRVELPARALQISDLREFAACVTGKKQPDYRMEHDLEVQECLLRACRMG